MRYSGKLVVITGCMFAGKTEELIQRLWKAEEEGKHIEAFKPTVDTRHEGDNIHSHSGKMVVAHRINLEAWPLPSTDVLAIDEAQFLSLDAVPRILEALRHVPQVILAGLDLTSKGEPFGPMPAFMAFADEVHKLRAKCKKCGQVATRSHRLSRSTETTYIGGEGAYEPRCLLCFDPKGG